MWSLILYVVCMYVCMCMYVVFCKIDHCIHIHWCRGGSSCWKGGGPNFRPMTGVPGGWPPGGGPGGRAPWRGLQGGRAPLRRKILNFWTQFARFGAYFLPTSYWKSLDLFSIKVFFFFFFLNYGIGLYKNGSFIVFTPVPPRVPQGVLYIISCRYAFVNRSYNIQGQLEVQLWGSKQKRGSRGQSPLVGVRGQSPLKLMLFRG